ncbi:hypothetical protein STRDD11_02144 [Streptococcus sp. DD11]|nr:hypothetical protein STRDD11_02144 [Streptococcus sp. DD11]
MKAQKIQTVSKSDYRTPQEQAIDKAVKDMKLSGAAEIYYRSKLAEKLQGKPRSEWKKIISNFNKVLKTDKGENLLDVFNMSRAEIEEKYQDIITAYHRGETKDYRWLGKQGQLGMVRADMVIERYKQTLIEEPGLSPSTLKKVDPAFKKKIDGMNQKELEKAYPDFRWSPLAPLLARGFYSSETDQANDLYLVARYQELDSQNPVSKHNPHFDQKRFEHIVKTGIDPVTNKAADKDLKAYAENYVKFAPTIKTGYDFLMVGMAAWSWNAYNKDLKNQKANAQIDEYYQVKDAVRNNVVKDIPEKIGMPDNANYAQKTYSNSFSEIGREKYSELAGKPINTIDDLVKAINTKKISIGELPVEYIERDGNTLILNTRTSQALTQAGIPRSEWFTINRTGDSLYESLLDGQLKRNKLTSEGISDVRPSTRKGN